MVLPFARPSYFFPVPLNRYGLDGLTGKTSGQKSVDLSVRRDAVTVQKRSC
jgi:hypothetical protein